MIMFEKLPKTSSAVPREYTRALNATKLDRVFAKPFVASLDGHRDGINCIAKHSKSLATVLSGACDGQVKIWNLSKRECLRTIQAHEGFVRGMCSRFCGTSFFTVGDDKTIKQWNMEAPGYRQREEPLTTILGKVYKEVYHTKRMQHVICVRWSADNKYILSGSDEMNIRIWKANASEKLGVLSSREKAAIHYNQKLKEKFQHHPQMSAFSLKELLNLIFFLSVACDCTITGYLTQPQIHWLYRYLLLPPSHFLPVCPALSLFSLLLHTRSLDGVWFKSPFSGITDLVNNVLQPQTKSQNEPQKQAATEEPETKLHQQFESYKDQVKKMADEAQSAPENKAEAPICGICHKTKFADGCGHVCSYCQTKFCARCGGRVSLRSNKVMWVCNLCRKQQEILTKSGAWFYSGPGSALPPGVTGVMRRRHEEAPQEKKAKLLEAPLLYQSSTVERSRAPGLLRQHSLDPERMVGNKGVKRHMNGQVISPGLGVSLSCVSERVGVRSFQVNHAFAKTEDRRMFSIFSFDE
ncbi:Regulating synaptic membrane exocytosis protein 2 [Bagarius yarrelli]|uniref:DDB1- and CUL4-associated factor 13 n=1 Tax=Bagarius yarrelli TaxID=175774 RepID=A0A556TM14_BAGYA|nr:Regulating synaptic membrane exocytosis protein 2 [Bagarius yarrelli]